MRPRSLTRFRRSLLWLIVTLAVLVAGFLVLGYLQGPKLSGAQVDPASVISQPGQQLRLFANQAVAQVRPSQVTVVPEVAHSVTTSGEVIAVQFDARLAYSTRYTVTVREVTSLYQPQPSTISYSFTTGSPTLYYLDRGQPQDRILRTGLSGNERTVVYSAPGIQDFVVSDGALVVATLGTDRTSRLSLVSLTDGAVETVALPEPGVVQKLHSAASGTLVGFVLTSAGESIAPTYSSTLFALDLQAVHTPKPVAGLDGDAVRVLDWEFMPDGSGLLALTRERTLLLIDPLAAGSVSPLGQFSSLGPVSRDGAIVTMTDPFGTAALTIADGSQKRLAPSPLENDSSLAYLGPVEQLAGGFRVEKLVIAEPGGTRFASAIAIDDGTTARVIYRTPDDAGSIESFTVSPNGQYLAVRVVPDISKSVSDGYYYDAASTSTETIVMDLAGRVVRSVEGFSLFW